MSARISSLLWFGFAVVNSVVHGFSIFGVPSRSTRFFVSCNNGLSHPQWNKLYMTSSDSLLARILSAEELRSSGLGTISVGMPKVIAPSNVDEDWLLWFHFRDDKFSPDLVKLSTGRIAFAKSKDGVSNWVFATPNAAILGPNKESGDWFFFDSEHVGLGDVIQPGRQAQLKFTDQGSVFLMYIFGGNGDEMNLPLSDGSGSHRKVVGSKMEIGVAVSRDGQHWSRIEGPLPYGSILGAGSEEEGDFDSMFVGWPNVLEVGREYRMYYHSFDARRGRFVVGLAVAADGLLRWQKKGVVFEGGGSDAFDGGGVSRRHVVSLPDGSYKMFYEGISKSRQHSIGVAVSSDGIQWRRVSENPILTASADPDAWDSGGVGSPHVVWLPSERRWRLYYVGYRQAGDNNSMEDNGIGLALSEDEHGTTFVRECTISSNKRTSTQQTDSVTRQQ